MNFRSGEIENSYKGKNNFFFDFSITITTTQCRTNKGYKDFLSIRWQQNPPPQPDMTPFLDVFIQCQYKLKQRQNGRATKEATSSKPIGVGPSKASTKHN